MIPLDACGRRRDGTRWRARSRQPGLTAGQVYEGLGEDDVKGYVWLEDGKWARCVGRGEVDLVVDEEEPK